MELTKEFIPAPFGLLSDCCLVGVIGGMGFLGHGGFVRFQAVIL